MADQLTKQTKAKKFKEGTIFYSTSFNELDIDGIKASDNIDHIVVGEEIAPTTQIKHWHVVGHLKKKKTLSFMQSFLIKDKSKFKEIHIEQVNSYSHCVEYCKKDSNVILEIGTVGSMQGRRMDLETIHHQVVTKEKTVSDIALENPAYIRYSKGLKDLQFYVDKSDAYKWRTIESFIYWGDTGTGKTKKAFEGDASRFIITAPNNTGTVWFDGYAGETTLIVDDFYGWLKQHELLRIMDGYPYQVQIKGSFTWAKWTKVIFTSNKNPNEWFKDGLTPAFLRRCPFKNWTHFVDESHFEYPRMETIPDPQGNLKRKFIEFDEDQKKAMKEIEIIKEADELIETIKKPDYGKMNKDVIQLDETGNSQPMEESEEENESDD